MAGRACIPVLFYWDDGVESEDLWWGVSAETGEDHGVGIPEYPNHGPGMPHRYWLWYRRQRWFEQERTRG